MPLSDKQKDYIKHANHAFNIAWGPVSCGKTFCQVLKWLWFIVYKAPHGCLLLMTGKSVGALYDNVVKDLITYSQGKLEYISGSGGAHIRYAKKNIKITCIGADNEADYKKISGASYEGWLADEITFCPPKFTLLAIKSCRPGIKPKYWTCNPDHPEHYIKTDFIDNSKLDIAQWFFTFEDNPLMDDAAIAELKASYANSNLMYQRYIEGKWTGFEGQVFDCWNPDKHNINLFQPPYAWKKWRSIDFGYRAPLHAFVCQWWCEIPKGIWPHQLKEAGHRIIGPAYLMYREIYTAGKTYDICAQEIKKLSEGEQYMASYADHDIEGIETMRKYGVWDLMKCVKGPIEEKPQVIHRALNTGKIYFMENARVNTAHPELKAARMPCCTSEEFPVAQWETDREGKVIREIIAKHRGGDHGIDATYYFLNSVESLSGPIDVKW